MGKLRNEHGGTRLTTLKPYGSLYHPVYLPRNSLYIKSTRMEEPIYSPFFGVLGASSAMVFSAMGAAYGTAKSGTGIAAMSVMRPELIMKSIIPVVMAGIIAIYGVVVAVLIAGQLKPAPEYTLYKGFVHLGAGLAVGLSGLAAGYAIGI